MTFYKISKFVYLKVFNDVCRKNTCNNHGACRPHVTFLTDEPMTTIMTNDRSFVSPKHIVDYQCKCRTGYTGIHIPTHTHTHIYIYT